MDIEFKETCWYRVAIPQGREEEVREKIESREIKTSAQLMDYLNGEGVGEYLLDTVQPLTPEENEGWATIEVKAPIKNPGGRNIPYTGSHIGTIWANGKH